MKIDLTDAQWLLLLEELGKCHVIRYMKGDDNGPLGEILEKLGECLKENDKEWIFHKVYREI